MSITPLPHARGIALALVGAVITTCAALTPTTTLAADAVEIEVNAISDKGVGKSVGKISASETERGFLRLDLQLSNELPPGGHGFHVHQNPDCGPAEKDGQMVAGAAAGGHFDPGNTGKHRGPSGDGHLGDLPILYIEADAEDGSAGASHSLIAPRLKLADIRGRSLVIHSGSDNFKDEPQKLGGGGARIACGVVPSG